MTEAMASNKLAAHSTPDEADGRRQRSDRSRGKIVQAMFELLGEGDTSPSAVAVADRADVGLRTVFRHFDDMESIYNVMVDQCLARVIPIMQAPYQATEWRERLIECTERSAEIYEMVFPAKLVLNLRRFQSDFLMDRHRQDVVLLRTALKGILPEDLTRNRILFSAIETTLSFATWQTLRQDQKLSVQDSKKATALMLSALISNQDE